MAGIILEYATKCEALPKQKALRKGTRGCLDALIIDQAVTDEAKKEKRDLSVAWVDYRMAYDLVPHRLINQVLRAVATSKPVRRMIKQLITKSANDLCLWTENGPQKIPIKMKRAIFQGDSLSPLLFCLCVAPISDALRKTEGFRANHQAEPVTHLMFVDDLNVYTENKRSLTEVVNMVEEVSGAMGMELGLRKCALAHLVPGRKVMDGGLKMETGKEIKELEEGEVYCYLGVAQRFGADMAKTKRQVEKEYITRTREVLRSEIGVRKKVEAQNVWGVGVLRYSLGTSDWARSNMRELDRTTRRILRQNEVHQYGASVARLYLPRAEGGRGLVCLEHSWETETLAAVIYLHDNLDPQVRQAMKHMEEVADENPNGMVSHAKRISEKYDLTNLLPTQEDKINPTKITNMVKNEQRRRLREEREGKIIHGVFAREVNKPECDKTATHAWLKNGSFKAETEGLIVAAQDGVIHTLAYRHRILGAVGNPMCRECGGTVELDHILSAC